MVSVAGYSQKSLSITAAGSTQMNQQYRWNNHKVAILHLFFVTTGMKK